MWSRRTLVLVISILDDWRTENVKRFHLLQNYFAGWAEERASYQALGRAKDNLMLHENSDTIPHPNLRLHLRRFLQSRSSIWMPYPYFKQDPPPPEAQDALIFSSLPSWKIWTRNPSLPWIPANTRWTTNMQTVHRTMFQMSWAPFLPSQNPTYLNLNVFTNFRCLPRPFYSRVTMLNLPRQLRTPIIIHRVPPTIDTSILIRTPATSSSILIIGTIIQILPLDIQGSLNLLTRIQNSQNSNIAGLCHSTALIRKERYLHSSSQPSALLYWYHIASAEPFRQNRNSERTVRTHKRTPQWKSASFESTSRA